MKREIKFRGKEFETGQWIEGSLTTYPRYYPTITLVENAELIPKKKTCVVLPETVGQFTGLCDKNGKEIYEGDICRYYNPEDKDGICEIEEDYALWISGTIKETNLLTPLFYLKCSSEWEVIGNIHQNPELLEVI